VFTAPTPALPRLFQEFLYRLMGREKVLLSITVEEQRCLLDSIPEEQAEEDFEVWIRLIR
jgi:hypothetical protein